MSLVRIWSGEIEGKFYDPIKTWNAFLHIVNQTPYVEILGTSFHEFPGGGISGLVLLSESHAAIHTWPELKRAWVELATCGNPEALDIFRRLVQDNLAIRSRDPAAWRSS